MQRTKIKKEESTTNKILDRKKFAENDRLWILSGGSMLAYVVVGLVFSLEFTYQWIAIVAH